MGDLTNPFINWWKDITRTYSPPGVDAPQAGLRGLNYALNNSYDPLAEGVKYAYESGAPIRDAKQAYLSSLARGTEHEGLARHATNAMVADMAQQVPSGLSISANQASDADIAKARYERARALAKGKQAIATSKDQSLQAERIAVAKAGRASQTLGIRAMADALAQKEGLVTGIDAFKSAGEAQKYNAIGGLTGIAAGAAYNYLRPTPPPPMTTYYGINTPIPQPIGQFSAPDFLQRPAYNGPLAPGS